MKAKAVVTGILILFVLVSIVYLIADEARNGGAVPEPVAGADSPPSGEEGGVESGDGSANTVIVYYFHGNVRCATCRTIESYAEEAVRTAFAPELASGKMKWRPVNVDEPENEHFVQDYQLVTRSLVLVKMENEAQTEWKNLDKIWQLVGSKPQFTEYVVENARVFMTGRDG